MISYGTHIRIHLLSGTGLGATVGSVPSSHRLFRSYDRQNHADMVHMIRRDGRQKRWYVKATDVDHIVPYRGNMKVFWDRSNWQALCHRRHSRKTRREDQTPLYKYWWNRCGAGIFLGTQSGPPA